MRSRGVCARRLRASSSLAIGTASGLVKSQRFETDAKKWVGNDDPLCRLDDEFLEDQEDAIGMSSS